MPYVYDKNGNLVSSDHEPTQLVRFYVDGDEEIYSTVFDPYPQYLLSEELDEGLIEGGVLDPGGHLSEAHVPTRLSQTQLTTDFIPRWKSLTNYSAGYIVFNPSGQAVTANTSHISGSTYDSTKWTLVNEGGGGGGPSVPDYYNEVTFSSASTQWTYAHNQGTYGIEAVTFDTGNRQVFGDVSWPDTNTIRVTFYHPMAGTMRVFT